MKAIYHQDASTQVTLDVLDKPANGKVSLGRAKEVLVTGCPISKDGAPGTCTLIGEPKDDAKKAAAALRLKAAAAAKAAVEAAKAADAAKGTAAHAELVKAAEAAEAAAKQAGADADEAEANAQ